mgnify:CR=1 FL=1
MCQNCDFRTNLFKKGILIETGVDGLYGRSGVFEDVIKTICTTNCAWSAA